MTVGDQVETHISYSSVVWFWKQQDLTGPPRMRNSLLWGASHPTVWGHVLLAQGHVWWHQRSPSDTKAPKLTSYWKEVDFLQKENPEDWTLVA